MTKLQNRRSSDQLDMDLMAESELARLQRQVNNFHSRFEKLSKKRKNTFLDF